MSRPEPGSVWRKHWPDTAHGSRYTYTVVGVTRAVVRWRRSDGLEGMTPVNEWSAYTREAA